MPTALELLETEICDDILVVDLESRSIVIPKNVSVLGVEADDETRILHFKVPRHYCEVDLAEFAIRVNYKNAKSEGDMYMVTDAVVEDDWITFDWVVGRHAFTKKGNVVFNVCLKDVFEGIVRREFNTTVAILPVLEGLETGEEIAEEHLDIFEQLREELASDAYEIAGEAVGSYINEHIDEIKGPKGDAFKYEDFTPEQLAALIGSKGDTGVGIKSIVKTGSRSTSYNGKTLAYDVYTITYTDDTTSEYELRQGSDGVDGETITGFTLIEGNHAPGTYDTYQMTLSSGRGYLFQVYNGANGEGAGDMTAQVYDPQGKATDIFAYIDEKTKDIDVDVTADEVAFADGETFQQKYDSGELTGAPGVSGVYVGSGEMPAGYNVQIDPNGESLDIETIVRNIVGDLTGPIVKLMSAEEYDAVTDWTTVLNEGEIAWRCE